jgi:hypothetical protein
MAEQDYATLAEVEAYAGVDFSEGIGPNDTQIGTMITLASRLMDAYAGKQFAGTETHTEYFDSSLRMYHLVLSERPVVSITSLQKIDANGNLTDLVESRDRDADFWLEDAGAGIVRFHLPVGDTVEQKFKVVYVAGASTAPADVRLCTILHVVRSAARAAMNDENCQERVKEFWRELVKDSENEYLTLLEKVKSRSLMTTAVFGQYQPPDGSGRYGRL